MLIAHLTDLSGDDDIAFAHAVALAARNGARLASVHACVGPKAERELPHAKDVLAGWSSSVSLTHERIEHECCDDVTDTILDALERLRPDLVVAATHPRSWLRRVLSGSVAEGVARNVRMPSLLLPVGGSCFADSATGKLALERVLIPAGDSDDARRGIRAATWLARLCGSEHAEFVLVHAADGRASPSASAEPSFSVVSRSYAAPLEDAIRGAVGELEPNAIVMVTQGHDTLDDVVFGSHTERVLHAVQRPILWIPAPDTVS